MLYSVSRLIQISNMELSGKKVKADHFGTLFIKGLKTLQQKKTLN